MKVSRVASSLWFERAGRSGNEAEGDSRQTVRGALLGFVRCVLQSSNLVCEVKLLVFDAL